MKLTANTDVSEFDAEQQDALLAEMQRAMLDEFQSASTLAERAQAVSGFASAATARHGFVDEIRTSRGARKLAADISGAKPN